MEYTQIESLVITSEGRRQIGEMAAAEGLDSVISQHLALLDLSDEWRWEIESARLEKIRDAECGRSRFHKRVSPPNNTCRNPSRFARDALDSTGFFSPFQ